MKIGALEAGGTKMVLAIYNEKAEIEHTLTLPTETPDITVPKMQTFFNAHHLDALGIASFGPIDLVPHSPTYGYITSTPKLPWRNFPILSALKGDRNIPVGFDTDVNVAAIAEVEQGVGMGYNNAIYITVGTGIGAGIYVNGQPVHGLIHPEVGHILLRPHADDPLPKGVCPFHDGCLEGLASGPALGARIQGDARTLPDNDPLFQLEAHYLAQMCVNLTLTLSPEIIILGGGVMARSALYKEIRKETQRLLQGYIQHERLLSKIGSYIVAPKLYPLSGLVGSYLIGKKAWDMANS